MKKDRDYKKDADQMILVAIKYIKGELNLKEATERLQLYGFNEKNISTVLGKTPRNNVFYIKK